MMRPELKKIEISEFLNYSRSKIGPHRLTTQGSSFHQYFSAGMRVL
jgi:hypothetical protein